MDSTLIMKRRRKVLCISIRQIYMLNRVTTLIENTDKVDLWCVYRVPLTT